MTMSLRAPILCTPLIFLTLSQTWAANFFVSSSVLGLSGDGSFQAPWSLTAALAHPAAVKPGDTIWLRGGVYYGMFTSKLQGTQGAPIIVRQYPGETAILDQNDSRNGAILRVEGGWTWFWGFEIRNSNPTRVLSVAGSNPDERRANSVDVYGDAVKLINLIIHDTGQGPGMWSQAENTEAYGCIIYNT